MKIGRQIYSLAIIIFIALMISGCCCSSEVLDQAKKEIDAKEKAKLTLVESKIETGEFGTWYIAGTVKNNSNSQISYVQISFNLYDRGGNQVGTAIDSTTNLEALGTWRIKAYPSDNNVSDYKLKELSGW